MIFIIILGFVALTLIDLPPLIKKNHRRELIIYSMLMILALTMAILQSLDIEMPNPVKDSQYWVKSLFAQLHLTYD